jgi:hypothetical protein
MWLEQGDAHAAARASVLHRGQLSAGRCNGPALLASSAGMATLAQAYHHYPEGLLTKTKGPDQPPTSRQHAWRRHHLRPTVRHRNWSQMQQHSCMYVPAACAAIWVQSTLQASEHMQSVLAGALPLSAD